MSNTGTKTTPAYTVSDVLAKIADVATVAAALAGGWPAIAVAAGLSAATATVGGGGNSNGSGSNTNNNNNNANSKLTVADGLKDFSAAAKGISDVLTAFGQQSVGSDNSTVNVETDNTMTLALTESDTYGSEAGAGPGQGDRFVYLSNVRAIWLNINGDVGLSILGFDGVIGFPAAALLADQQALASGGAASNTGLDAQTLQLLLDLDPYCSSAKRLTGIGGPPVIGPPRFSPAIPQHRGGSGTVGTGDVFSIANEQISETKSSTTNATTTVTDVKPGWMDVIFGAANTETTSTVTLTNGLTLDDKSDETITNTITMVSQDQSDPYGIELFYDGLFGTLIPVPTGSPLLQGVTILGNAGDQLLEAAPKS